MISVALCTYNGENFLQDQLDSILQQKLKPSEMVICDDASKDRTLDILETFKRKASFPVNIRTNNRNIGSTKNFENAIRFCQGEIIILSDQDDVWKPHKIERLVKTLQDNPEAGYAFSDAELVDENLNSLRGQLWESIGFTRDIRQDFSGVNQFQTLIVKALVTGATLAFRSQIGKLAMPFPADWVHDRWIALLSTGIGSIGIPIDEPLIYYRQHAGQQIGVSNRLHGEKRTLFAKVKNMKKSSQILSASWEKKGIQILMLKEVLMELKKADASLVPKQNLKFLEAFETHFFNRERIFKSNKIGRYRLICQEAFSGRYAKFSESWKSIVRDMLF